MLPGQRARSGEWLAPCFQRATSSARAGVFPRYFFCAAKFVRGSNHEPRFFSNHLVRVSISRTMAAQTYACEVKLFNKWSYDDISVGDISLEDYIAVKPKFAQFVPHTAGRFQQKRFKKAQCPIVERVTCSLMMHGRNNGKKVMAIRIIQHAFDIVHLLTDQNPIQQLVDAIINSSPREDSTRVGSGGVVRRQAVDVSPMRRVNQAIYLITQGARAAAFRNIKSIAEVGSDQL
jgi:small subunit ribosomal protein S5e